MVLNKRSRNKWIKHRNGYCVPFKNPLPFRERASWLRHGDHSRPAINSAYLRHDVEINCNLAPAAISKRVNGGIQQNDSKRLMGRESAVRMEEDLLPDHRVVSSEWSRGGEEEGLAVVFNHPSILDASTDPLFII